MRIYIDADGCPVVDSTLRLAAAPQGGDGDSLRHLPRDSAAGGADGDGFQGGGQRGFRPGQPAGPGDVVITQDYGLAAMCLAKRAKVLHQDGMRYSPDNIDALLLARHTARKIRQAGGRLRGSAKRKPEQDRAFEEALERLLSESEPK